MSESAADDADAVWMPSVCSSSEGDAAWVSSPDTSDESATDSEVISEAVTPPTSVANADNLSRTLALAQSGRAAGGE